MSKYEARKRAVEGFVSKCVTNDVINVEFQVTNGSSVTGTKSMTKMVVPKCKEPLTKNIL